MKFEYSSSINLSYLLDPSITHSNPNLRESWYDLHTVIVHSGSVVSLARKSDSAQDGRLASSSQQTHMQARFRCMYSRVYGPTSPWWRYRDAECEMAEEEEVMGFVRRKGGERNEGMATMLVYLRRDCKPESVSVS
jgi:hypothetical protein